MISPLLANIYLHYAFDLWANGWRQQEATGDMIIVRYADDFIVGFQHESDARRFLEALRRRLGEYALSLHPEKTRLIEFGRFAADNRRRRGLGKPETFNFLGFTFICGKSRRDKFQIKRKSRRDRMRAKLKEVKQALRRSMHRPIPEQGKWLRQVVRGYFNYHAVPTNVRALAAFRNDLIGRWRRILNRRSQRGAFTWERMRLLADHWLPKPAILHHWPRQRFAVRHPRWEPYAGNLQVRLCVQLRLACSAGGRPAGARVRSPVVRIAGWRETKILKPIDAISLGEITSHRAVTTVNVDVASKVSGSEG